jgi:hypothetical protein
MRACERTNRPKEDEGMINDGLDPLGLLEETTKGNRRVDSEIMSPPLPRILRRPLVFRDMRCPPFGSGRIRIR